MNLRSIIHANFRHYPPVRESWLRTLAQIEALPTYQWPEATR